MARKYDGAVEEKDGNETHGVEEREIVDGGLGWRRNGVCEHRQKRGRLVKIVLPTTPLLHTTRL